MVDLFNVMDQEKKHSMNQIPDRDQKSKLMNIMQIQENMAKSDGTTNLQNIDQNMWKHFQNLLKKNQSNPYLKQAMNK